MMRLLQGAVPSSLLAAAPALRHDLSTIEMIVEAGYPAEKHEVTTEDCYINTLHRIPGEGKVVFLQHGLIDSSATWVIAGPEHGGLAFRLAEAGYDVWLGVLALHVGRDGQVRSA